MDKSALKDIKTWALLLLPITVGLVASTILLVDYIRPAPVFCGLESGCGAVRNTRFSSLLGVSTPVYGVAGFLLLAIGSVLRGARVRLGLLLASGAGAAVAAFLLSVQGSLGTYCPYCVAVDLSAIATFGLAIWRFKAAWDPPAPPRTRAVGAAILSLAVLVPAILGFVLPPPVPRVIAEELAKTPRGKVTVVDFVDFECPFCRETHAELRPILEAHKDRVRVVRKQVPLTRIHPHALEAARAACCGEDMGKGDEMADLLFTAPEEELTRAGCEKMAVSLGLDLTRFRACLIDPKTDARIKADTEAFRASGGHGLPTIWIDEIKLEGAQDRATLEQAMNRALGS